MSANSKNLSLFLLLINFLFFSCCNSLLDEQGQALLAWKKSLNTNSDALPSWNVSNKTPCNWFGVKCNLQGEVEEISLKSLNLQGSSLPSNFQPLKSLKVLVLSSMNITGRIPKEFGDYQELVFIDLSENSLFGEIPEEICRLSKLQSLALHANSLEENIPFDIGNLSSLVNLTLFDNKLSGEIPKSIGLLTKLQVFRAGGNKNLNGELPSEIGNCTDLVVLGLAETSISGSIPSSIGMLKKLQTIAIYTTKLSGSIPEEIGNCSELQNLYLYENSISGSIPRQIGELGKLQSLLLWQNKIVGTIPEELGRCKDLSVIDLSENLLTGSIPISFGKLSNLQALQLSVNRLSGIIPPEISNCASLSQLEVDNNAISGEIPSVIGKLRSLTLFFAWKNKLTGKIPNSLSECENLQALDLSYNRLTGTIPKELFVLKNLTQLMLLSNDLEGFIPPDIGNCTSLRRLRLNRNRLVGIIPSEIANLKSLNFLDLNNNHLVGEIPSTISRCRNLEFIDLSHNKLSGNLDAVSNLQSLVSLNVSFNKFSGELPNTPFFRKLPLSDLTGNSISKAKDDTKLAMMIILFILLSTSAVLALFLIHVAIRAYIANNINNSWVMTLYNDHFFSADDDVVKNLKPSNVIDTGSSGVSYKVKTPKGQIIAVKKTLPSTDSEALMSEIDMLCSIKHKNITRLLGWGLNLLNNKDMMLQFYEYLPSLSSVLHGSEKGKLEWDTRYEIILGVAQALTYLHHDCVPSMLHADVKATNVLLGPGYHPYLTCFGLVKIASEKVDDAKSNPVQRPTYTSSSYGYIDPELDSMQKINEKTDVYSFGVVILEVLTGKHPLDPSLPEGVHLVQWVKSHLASKRDPFEILDSNLRGSTKPTTMHEILQTLAVSILCVNTKAHERPTMKDTLAMLNQFRYFV
ncbi:leucine-rich repeat receptor-like serine/threonine-protein kinase RGI4 [Vicia villosa]|uniref:leucine-rich repeat receptor-like serine/threonine-protein kinase RGI4 n=1 Tax=Vicia villosa TaxID=3911 RepID=UPI00273AB1DC|nr:leucine-rich repeat receptor-like serine/threonine-protein kinase RGI4 [Vicia villosa]